MHDCSTFFFFALNLFLVLEIAKLLLQCPISADATNELKKTPLMYAARARKFRINTNTHGR